jgi:hypothetical protein
METLLSICLGIGLSAACGFRVFVPLLITSVAAQSSHLTVAPGFQWVGTNPALITFSVATGLEIAGYYIPWVDHLLDTLASPAAIVAGILVAASMITGMSPLLKWTLAIIAGGGAAGLVQGTTVMARAASTATTAGLGNPLVATLELVGSIATSVLSLVVPVLVPLFLVILLFLLGRKLFGTSRATKVPDVSVGNSTSVHRA